MHSLISLLRIATASVFARRLNLIIGGLLLFICAGLVILSAIWSGIARSTESAMVRSFVGQLHLFAASYEDAAVFRSDGPPDDAPPMEDFAKVRQALQEVENVKEVVPMALGSAAYSTGNLLDRLLEKLRTHVTQHPADAAGRAALKDHVTRIAAQLREDLSAGDELLARDQLDADLGALDRATSEAFWTGFEQAPLPALEFLENQIAPMLLAPERMDRVVYLGTEMGALQRTFGPLEIIDGEALPPGRRGILFSKWSYEEYFKLFPARRLDRIKEERANGRLLADDDELSQLARDNRNGVREITLLLDTPATEEVTRRLAAALPGPHRTLDDLLRELFTLDDANFDQRYALFYEAVAPFLELYWLKAGDLFTIRAQARNGHLRSVSIPFYGTYRIPGMSDSALAHGMGISPMDLVTFRELYGFPTEAERAELAALELTSLPTALTAADAEALLEEGPIADAVVEPLIEEQLLTGSARRARALAVREERFDPATVDQGVVLHAAVLLHDPSRQEETAARLREVIAAKGLDAQVIGWRQAAGYLGGMVSAAAWILTFFVAVVFAIVALVVNNCVLLVVSQRQSELGTLRAIGAGKRFVLLMVQLEILVVSLLFSGLGLLLGAWAVRGLGEEGIPANGNPFLDLFFGGPTLYPTVSGLDLLRPLVVVVVISALAALYPAARSTRVPPLRAMQVEE